MHSWYCRALWIKASSQYILLSVEKHEGSAVAGLARDNSLGETGEREHAVRNGLEAGGRREEGGRKE